MRGAEPARLAAGGFREEADLVVAGLVGCESKAATGATLLRNYTVIVVEKFLFAQGQYEGLLNSWEGGINATNIHQQ